MNLFILIGLLGNVLANFEENYCVLNDDGTECLEEEKKSSFLLGYEIDKKKGLSDNISQTNYEELLAKIEIDKKMPNGLSRRNGVKVGHTEDVNVGDGKVVKVITRALRPLLFEIPDILTHEECDHIIKRAIDPKEGGMFSSKAKGGLTPNEVQYNYTGEFGKASGWFGEFSAWDINDDKYIDIDEVISVIHASFSLWMLENDIKEIWEKMNVTVMDDGIISEEEFETLNTFGLKEYLHKLSKNDPRFKTRTSNQVWLNMDQSVDPLIHKIRERLVKLTGLDRKIIYGGEMLQVLNYLPNGHYHAHHDSETHQRADLPCCHQYSGDVLTSVGECKLCRYITFVLYLNNVEEGGGTAFPIADNITFNEMNMVQYGNVSTDKYNMMHGCKLSNLVIQPKKGSAVLWYNHLRNETDGWMGELDWYSLHGGCNIIKGEKWMANMWIPAPFGNSRHIPSIYLNNEDYEKAEAISQKE
ncbi:transmembrane prolyl 4-hydroxylase-like isoform X2 [Hydra vulgaris]|uniref:Transmembrane prolyl 4-hydroxylase-like isoform X2 n=1 Tax=Hydra vulgaris TaxID=6087 RepID=A0ABM4DNV7_HYDVU